MSTELVLLVAMLALVGISMISRTRRNTAWQDAARELGFTASVGSKNDMRDAEMVGDLDGYWVKVTQHQDVFDEYQSGSTTFVVSHSAAMPPGVVRSKGLRARVVPGHGEPILDGLAELHGGDRVAMAAFLTPERGASITELLGVKGQVEIGNDTVTVEQGFTQSSATDVVRTVCLMVAVAHALEGEHGSDASGRPAPPRRPT